MNSYKQHTLGRAWQQDASSQEGPEPGSVYTQSEVMKDVFMRCHEKTDVQVCTLTIVHYRPVTVNIRAITTYATFVQSAISISMHEYECDCNINRCLFFAG
jgi:hypothetical protein